MMSAMSRSTLLHGALLFMTVPLCAGVAHAAGVVTDCQNFGTVGTPVSYTHLTLPTILRV